MDFASRAVDAFDSGVTDGVLHETRRCLVNVMATAVGAASDPGISSLVRTAQRLDGSGAIGLPGRHERVGALWAAEVVGSAAHLDDFDDTHLATVIHPGAATLGTLWSLVATPMDLPLDVASTRGRKELVAAAVGIEAQLRIGMAMSPYHYDRGWHITGTCGVLGAATTAGLLLGLEPEDLAGAIGIAASMTVGVRESFGTFLKPLHAGKAAANGVLSAMLRRGGITSSTRVLEAPRGYFGVLADSNWDPEWLGVGSFGAEWLMADNTYKPYPCGIVAHPAIEAALRIRDATSPWNTPSIDSVRVICNPLVPELMGNRRPETGLEARFSAVHVVAAALVDGEMGLAQVANSRVVDRELQTVRDRVRLEVDDSMGRESALVEVSFVDGSRSAVTIDHVIGSTHCPFDDDALNEKFDSLVAPVLGQDQTRRLRDAAWSLGDRTCFADVAAIASVEP
jgi:2-methylcitrate dehydratase PrpD